MAWLREAMSAVFADDLGSLSGLYQGPRVDALSLVLRDGAVRPWCDEAGTAVAETCADVLRSALARALDTLGETYGADPARWQWGLAHPAFSEHRPLGLVPYVGRFFNISVPSPGGPFTLNRGDLRFGSERPFANVHAASYRSVFDLADLDRSLHMQTSGQSGNPFSPHYDDLAARWAAGEYLPMTTDPAVYRPGALGVTVIAPPPP
ncbi:MAG: penicillin acylase family protein, partial [Alphaproteobacteria bacterium]|nr:penicillin acylase family protein [Alphaproteobacteria bacterium]MDX5368152.1 penicillin acylase family protein [Alphaproteobacteria bacterium]MDX5462983.1 penicillin acylase family protein [Alphaproteobacteria bacterium]